MSKKKKIMMYVLAGVTVTAMEGIRKLCEVKAKANQYSQTKRAKMYRLLDKAFSFTTKCVENLMAFCSVIALFT